MSAADAGRERPSLIAPPGEPRALVGFPRTEVSERIPVYRVVRTGTEPWWFSSDGSGRFDLADPWGTCYLALDPLVALLEVLGGARIVTDAHIDARRLRVLRLPAPVTLADTTSRRARGFGITAEIATEVPYTRPRAWAEAWWDVDLDGVRYRARHDPGGGAAVAVFGPGGAQPRWRRGREQRIDAILRHRLAEEAGVSVTPVPASASVRQIHDGTRPDS